MYDSELPPASGERSIGQVQRDGEHTLAAAEKWLTARDGKKPFFLFFHIYEPHKPYTPPPRFAACAPYDGEIAFADEIVGRLFDRLRALDVYDRATIVLLSDHGEGLGDHGEQEHGLFLYNATVHVPLVVKLPGQQRTRRVAVPVQQIDLVPTILDLAGAPKRMELHGRSLQPLLDGTGTLPDTGIYSEALYSRYHFGWSELYGLTGRAMPGSSAPRATSSTTSSAIRRKRRSIAAERPQVRQAMRAALETLIAHTPIGAPSAVTDEDRQRLAALGYVGGGASASLTLPGDSLADPKDKVGVLEKCRHATDLAGALRFAEAATIYREVLADDPEMTDVWLQLAEVYTRQGLQVEAVQAFKEIIKRNPKEPGSLIGAGAGLLRLGKLDEARLCAELAVSVAPSGAHELLAKIALASHDREAALREAKLAQEADPTLPMPLYVEGLLAYNAGRYQEALGAADARREALEGAHRADERPQLLHRRLARAAGSLSASRAVSARGSADLPAQPAGPRRPRHALSRHGPRPRVGARRRGLLRVSPTPEGRAMAAQLWNMFGEPGRRSGLRFPEPGSMTIRPLALLMLAAGLSVPQSPPRPGPGQAAGVPVGRGSRPVRRPRDGRVGPSDPGPAAGGARDRRGRRAAGRSSSSSTSTSRPAPMPTRRCARSRRRCRATAARPAVTCICWSSIKPTSRRAASRSRARGRDFIKSRVRPSDRVAVIGIPGPGPELGFTADRTRAIAELAKVHADLERQVKSAGGNLSVHEAYEITDGNDKVIADVMTRQSADLTADVGAAASAGMAGTVDRGARARGQSEEPGDHTEDHRRERANGGRAGRRVGARFAPAAVRCGRAVPRRRRAKDGGAVFRRLPPAQCLAGARSRSPPPPPRATRCSTPSI